MEKLSIDVYSPGKDLTAYASAAVTRATFVAISGNRTNGSITVATATAGGRIAGVARYDADADTLTAIARGNSRVVQVVAGANLTAFAEVEVGANGTAVPLDEGVPVGYAITGAPATTLAQISLY